MSIPKVALIGFGRQGRHHFAALQQLAAARQVELVGVCDVIYQPNVGVPFFLKYPELLSETHPNVVIVTAPNFLHHQICLAALEAGCDVIKEKPLDITLEGGLKLVNQAKKLGRMIMTTQQRYHSPLFQEAKNLLAYIGRLHHFSYIFTLDDHQQSWYWEREKSGGGSWLNIGWHGISTLSWLLGDITQVALAENSGGKRPWTYTTDHSSLAKLVLDNSVNGTAFFSCVYPKEEQLLIYGSTGRLEINRKQIRLQSPQLQIEMKVAAEEEGVYLKQLHFLLNAWQTHNYNMDRDLKILQVIQAGTNSFSQGGRYEKC